MCKILISYVQRLQENIRTLTFSNIIERLDDVGIQDRGNVTVFTLIVTTTKEIQDEWISVIQNCSAKLSKSWLRLTRVIEAPKRLFLYKGETGKVFYI